MLVLRISSFSPLAYKLYRQLIMSLLEAEAKHLDDRFSQVLHLSCGDGEQRNIVQTKSDPRD